MPPIFWAVSRVSVTRGGAQAIWDIQSVTTSTPLLEWGGASSQVVQLGDLNTAGSTGAGQITVENVTAGTTATWQVGPPSVPEAPVGRCQWRTAGSGWMDDHQGGRNHGSVLDSLHVRKHAAEGLGELQR